MNTPENEFKDLQDLLALKRCETPGEEYFESFVDNFHRRQRQELMAEREKSSLGIRFQNWCTQLGWGKALLGVTATYAAIAVMISFSGSDQGQLADKPLPNVFASDSMHVNMEVDRPVNFAPREQKGQAVQLEEDAHSYQEF